MSAYVFQEAESRRGKQLRRRGEREAEEREAESLVESLSKGIEPLPFELSTAPREERLDVPEACIGMLIGKKGENLKRIEKACKVTVQIKDGETSQTRSVTVKGSSGDVAAALRELDFASEALDVPEGMEGWICGRGARHLRMVKELSGAATVSLRREGEEEEQRPRGAAKGTANANGAGTGTAAAEAADSATPSTAASAQGGRCWLELKGRRECVADARMCLEAHLSYYPAFQEMEELEADLDRQIAEAQAQLGRRPGRGAAAAGADRGAERGARGAARPERGANAGGGASVGAPIGSSPRRSRGRGGRGAGGGRGGRGAGGGAGGGAAAQNGAQGR